MARINHIFYSILFWGSFVGILLVTALLYYQRTQPTILSFAAPPPPIQVEQNESTNPVRVLIPSLKIDVDVEPGYIENNIWSISDHYVNHLHTSAHPGDNGNIIMYGHNSGAILGKLPKIQHEDHILIIDAENNEHIYRVSEIHTVTPDSLEFIQPTNEEVLTLYTCTGLFNSKRFIVRATPSV